MQEEHDRIPPALAADQDPLPDASYFHRLERGDTFRPGGPRTAPYLGSVCVPEPWEAHGLIAIWRANKAPSPLRPNESGAVRIPSRNVVPVLDTGS